MKSILIAVGAKTGSVLLQSKVCTLPVIEKQGDESSDAALRRCLRGTRLQIVKSYPDIAPEGYLVVHLSKGTENRPGTPEGMCWYSRGALAFLEQNADIRMVREVIAKVPDVENPPIRDRSLFRRVGEIFGFTTSPAY